MKDLALLSVHSAAKFDTKQVIIMEENKATLKRQNKCYKYAKHYFMLQDHCRQVNHFTLK